MHYVISDIHGDYDRFMQMLEKINFSDEDILYVLGDMIDRKKDGIKVIEYVMSHKNIIALLGNHEDMCIRTFKDELFAKELWIQNGGNNTYRTLMYKRTSTERANILKFLKSLPDFIEVSVNKTDFYLVHGWTGNNIKDRIWGRPFVDSIGSMSDKYIIVGHTPVCFLFHKPMETHHYLNELKQKEDHMKIFHGQGFIDIDCGCGNDSSTACLACLCLEDFTEYYV